MTEQEANKFLSRISFAGALAIYACKLSYDKNTAFDRDDYAKKAYSTTPDYLNGFLVCCYALELINYNRNGNVLTITKVDPILSQKIKSSLNNFVSNTSTWDKHVKNTENYFK